MGKPKRPTDEQWQNRRMEYETVAASWRFFSGLRFIMAAFVATLESGLFTLYLRTLEHQTTAGVTSVSFASRFGPKTIAMVGLLITLAILLIEQRSIVLISTMLERGVRLELELKMPRAHFSCLSEPRLRHPPGLRRLMTHTVGLRFIYLTIYVLWLGLFVFSQAQ